MNCSWDENRIIKSDSFAILKRPYDGNHPVVKTLDPKRSGLFMLTVVDLSSGTSRTTADIQFGFINSDTTVCTQEEFLLMFQEEHNRKIVWEYHN